MHLPTRRLVAALLSTLAVAVSPWWLLSAAAVAEAAWAQSPPLPDLGGGTIWSVASSPGQAGFVAAGTDRGVYVSSDAGVHWAATTLTGVRVWTVGFDARTPTRLFAGTDGRGAQLSTDGGKTWSDASTGLNDLTVRAFAFSLDGIAAGTNRGVSLSPDGTAWHDGGLDAYSISSLAVAANSPSLVLLAGSDRGDVSHGFLFRFGASASTWETLQNGLPAQAVLSSVSAGPTTATVTKRPLVATTSKGTYRSGDSGNTWTQSTGVPQNLTLTTATISPLDPNLVYAGADQGGSSGGDLFRSTDGGQSFGVADQGLPEKVRQVESIAVEQTSPPTVITALDPASGGVLFTQVDTTAPAPPPLVAEAPGAPVPSMLATTPPTPAPSRGPAAPTPSPATSGVGQFFDNAVHFPIPLLFEVLFVLLVAYLWVRWRQHYYVEGPP